jgi:putative ABC transport system permease protein
MHTANPFLGRLWGSLGRMAPRDVVNSLSRTSIAVMALMVAVSVTIGVSLMISSFRYTVQVWLAETLRGDIYISTPGLNANQASGTVDPQVVEIARRTQGVNRVEVLRAVPIDSPSGPVQVAASSNHEIGNERLFKSLAIPQPQVWSALLEGSVLVSEPLASRLGLPAHGASVELETPAGLRRFPVVGVYYDYSSSQGNLLMALPFYQQTWGDMGLTAVQLRLAPGYDADELARNLQNSLGGSLPAAQSLVVRSNRNLRSDVLEVFDRTFAITAALQVLAMLVAFIGVLSALLSLELERQHELGILRAVGLTIRQVWGLILLETGLMGLVAGLLAIPAGFMLALILVYIINLRSFGWTLQLQLSPQPFLAALLISVTAALLAGIYPAWRIGGMRAAEALRNE